MKLGIGSAWLNKIKTNGIPDGEKTEVVEKDFIWLKNIRFDELVILLEAFGFTTARGRTGRRGEA